MRAPQPTQLVYSDLDLADRSSVVATLDLPRTASDTEIVLAAFRRWGTDCGDHLVGQFAFAVWDGERRRLVAVRDIVGLRSLVYARSADGLVLGGDLRRVMSADGVADTLDDDVFLTCVVWENDSRLDRWGRTCYRDVDTLRPAHAVIADPGRVEQRRYWHPDRIPSASDLAAVVRDLRDLVCAVVTDLTPATATIGTHLSGGLDSSAVAVLAARARQAAGLSAPVAFAWQPPPGLVPTVDQARIEAVRARFDLAVRFCPSTVESQLAEMTADATVDPLTMVRHELPVLRAASSDGVSTVMSGWGGDEAVTFSGRGLAARTLIRDRRFGPLLHTAASGHAGLREVVAGVVPWLPWPPWRRRQPRGWHQTVEQRRCDILEGRRPSALRSDVLRRANLIEDPLPPQDPHDRMRWLFANGHLGTRASDWHLHGSEYGVGYRFPLLDRRLLEFAMSLPPEAWLIRGGHRRWPLRDALAGLLPEPARLSEKDDPASREHDRQVARAARHSLTIDLDAVDEHRLEKFDRHALAVGLASRDDAAWRSVRWLGPEAWTALHGRR